MLANVHVHSQLISAIFGLFSIMGLVAHLFTSFERFAFPHVRHVIVTAASKKSRSPVETKQAAGTPEDLQEEAVAAISPVASLDANPIAIELPN